MPTKLLILTGFYCAPSVTIFLLDTDLVVVFYRWSSHSYSQR